MNRPSRSRVSLATVITFQGVAMSRLFKLALLVAFALDAGGCCMFLPSPFDLFRNVTVAKQGQDQFRIDLTFVPDAQLATEDTSPWWDLGRHAAAKGDDRLLVITRTTSYADKDENDREIIGTLRDRKVERVWLTIPAGTPLGKTLKLEDLEVQFLTGYEVNLLDGKGYFKGPHLMKGYVNAIEEQCGMLVALFDIEVRPNRPFQAENWKLEGKHTLRKSETIQVKESRDVKPAP